MSFSLRLRRNQKKQRERRAKGESLEWDIPTEVRSKWGIDEEP